MIAGRLRIAVRWPVFDDPRRPDATERDVVWRIVIGLVVVVIGFAAAVFAYGATHKRTSTRQAFAAAQDAAFRAFNATPLSKYATWRSGLRTHYLQLGDRHPVLAIHGGNSMAASWARLAQPLSERSRLIMVDRPGCGLTDKLNYRGIPFRAHAVQFTATSWTLSVYRGRPSLETRWVVTLHLRLHSRIRNASRS